jgi:predicted dehydrogenase/nucleoside-diphosphate-sugar epimerase
VGCGYIADFHAQAIRAVKDVELVSVCDTNLQRAQSFATRWNVEAVFESLESMLGAVRLDAIHVLVPPDRHFEMAQLALQSGLHVFLEKPICASTNEAEELLQISHTKNLQVGVNHNFLFTRAYERLREAIRTGKLGPLDYISIDYLLELEQIRFGPFDSWMLREPSNIFVETAPHFLSVVRDLLGESTELSVTVDRKVDLPGGNFLFRRWRMRGTAGRVAVNVNMYLGPGFDQRIIYVHGLFGSATVDLDANTCVIDRTSIATDFDRSRRGYLLARQHWIQASETLVDYVLSLFKLGRRGNPYQSSIVGSVEAFYSALQSNKPLDHRIDGECGRNVVAWSTSIVPAANIEQSSSRPTLVGAPTIKPSVLVIGGFGFIGRELIRQLLASGYGVRAMGRNPIRMFEIPHSENIEIVRGDVRSENDLKVAMRGMEFVYDLAVSSSKTWMESLQDIVEPTRLLGQICLDADVKRLIYTGTIASYWTGAKAGIITDQTPLDTKISRRNYYARAKAMAEDILMEMHRTKGLPVVIFRPGIVIGPGGNPFHWGVGKFSKNSCEVWGDGNNMLPFVLVTDVANALVRGIQVPGIEGQCYNLVGDPLLTAHDYMNELQRLAGMGIAIHYHPIWRFYISDVLKWLVKLAVGHSDRIRIPSYHDWESRTNKAIFDCSRARSQLNWRPNSERQRLIEEGIGGSLQEWLQAWR